MDLSLKYKGIFDLSDLYNKLQKFFESKQFRYFERTYEVKGDEVKIEAEFEQETTDYIKIEGELKIEIFGLTDVEVDNKILQSGRMELGLVGDIVKDQNKRFESDTQGKLKNLYERLKKEEIKKIEKTMEETITGAFTLVKKELDMDV